jgi:hypothetical protein
MPADLAVNRAGIQARAAADAEKRIPEFTFLNRIASIIDDHDVSLCGTVEIIALAWVVDQ